MDDESIAIADNKGMWRSSTVITTRKRSSREVGQYIIQLTKLNATQIFAVMAMNHDNTTFNIEFSTPENKQFFEAEVEKNKQSVGNFFRLKQPKVKTKSILCTHVPGSYNDERLHMQLFGKQKPRIISVATERCLAEDGSPLWATGRRWINVAAADFDQLRAVPTSIQIAKEWRISIHMQKGSAGKCFLCNKTGHSKQQCRELVDKPPETSTPAAATKTPSTEKQFQSNNDEEFNSSRRDSTWRMASELQEFSDSTPEITDANIDTRGRQTERQIKINKLKRALCGGCSLTQNNFFSWLHDKAEASNNDDEKHTINEEMISVASKVHEQTKTLIPSHFPHLDEFLNEFVDTARYTVG